MSAPQAAYSFLPWLRQGLGTQVTSGSGQRPSIDVKLQLTGDQLAGGAKTEPFQQKIELYGPGDLIGVEPRAVIRVEPRPEAANVEPNYLAHIEFYEEDFPWRYSPTPASDERLIPWLTLIVLEKREEFNEGRMFPGQRLPTIELKALNAMPPKDGLWAWAHVHVNRDLLPPGAFASQDGGFVSGKFKDVFEQNPDLTHSRPLCPRKLAPNRTYHAFLVPTFESGRLAGLGRKPAAAVGATTVAWEDYNGRADAEPNRLPYYNRWSFQTGKSGDFEDLVRLLKPRKPDARVGVRDMDVRNPGADLPGFTEPLLKLGGALRVPIEGDDPRDSWEQPYPHQFQQALASFINLADDYAQSTTDPVVTAPLYGCWHALMKRLLKERDGSPIAPNDNWVHELNLDPRYRVPAGFGTRVVQRHQEEYMKAAWEQVGEIIEANRRVRWALLAREVAVRWYDNHLRPLQAVGVDQAFAITGPVHRRVVKDGTTIHYQESLSHLSTTAVSAAFRRITRPRGRLMKSFKYTAAVRPDNLLTRMSDGTVRAAPPKTAPPGLLTVADMAAKFPVLSEECWTTRLPRCPNFRISPPTADTDFRCRPDGSEPPNSDSARFKKAVHELCVLIRTGYASGEEPPPVAVDIPSLTAAVVSALDPATAIPRRVASGIHLPGFVPQERFQEAMAYPRIDKPMYEPLKELSSEHFLPNINLIEQNSITLLQTNQKFIESYMVGLNHEFARELLWREYPTDQRGSYFRQFWNIDDFHGLNDLTAEKRREALYDIRPLHLWPRLAQPGKRVHELGYHDNRELNPTENEQELVLVIRGELLKRYHVVIYAQAARWDTTNGAFDNKKPRLIDDLSTKTEEELRLMPRDVVQMPLFRAFAEPDIYFLGFDLTVEKAKGDLKSAPTDKNAGWFFIFKERPGEPRFGLDDKVNTPIYTVNDLSWRTAVPNISDGAYLPAGSLGNLGLPATDAGVPAEMKVQYAEDKLISDPGVKPSSARWAYLLLQVPVMMAVHAAEMLAEQP